jgi:hypothetical protein
MNVSLLIAAEAYYFSLDGKVTKDQDKKMLPRTSLYLLARFFVGPCARSKMLVDLNALV